MEEGAALRAVGGRCAATTRRTIWDYGDSDLVPTKLYDSGYMEAATDDCFVDFDGNNVPDDGRGPTASAQCNGSGGSGRKDSPVRKFSRVESVLLASDINDGYGFSAVNTALRGLLPPGQESMR